MRWLLDRSSPDHAQMHALVIGVGDYDHLHGGRRYREQPAPVTLGLGQLTSPMVSAHAFADWLATRYQNGRAPVGSIELLVSSGSSVPAAGTSFEDQGTKLQEIRDAFDRWSARCARHADNVGIFYFCGHGTDGATSFLLPTDFGADPNAPFGRAIDFWATYYGMQHCQAGTQLYFLDSCRQIPPEAANAKGTDLAAVRVGADIHQREAPVYRAAELGGQAYGGPGRISLFTSTLIRCLDAFGAESEYDGRWRISTATFGPAFARMLGRVHRSAGWAVCYGQTGRPSVIHEIARPLVLADVTCTPQVALEHAALGARSTNGTWSDSRPPDASKWELELDQGVYDFGAFFADDDERFASGWHASDKIVVPPYFACDLDVSC